MEFTVMSIDHPASNQSCFERCAFRIAETTIAEAPVCAGEKIMLQAYMEPPWVFPALVAMVEQRWSAGQKSPTEIHEITKRVEKWLEGRDFFTTETPPSVRRIFAGMVVIAAHYIFQTKSIERN